MSEGGKTLAAEGKAISKLRKALATAEWGKAASWAEVADALDAAGASEKSAGETREIYEEFVAKRAATQVCGIRPQLYYR